MINWMCICLRLVIDSKLYPFSWTAVATENMWLTKRNSCNFVSTEITPSRNSWLGTQESKKNKTFFKSDSGICSFLVRTITPPFYQWIAYVHVALNTGPLVCLSLTYRAWHESIAVESPLMFGVCLCQKWQLQVQIQNILQRGSLAIWWYYTT